MAHPYHAYVRTFAERGGGLCTVGVVVGQQHPEGGRPNLHGLPALLLGTTSVQGATLDGLLHALSKLHARAGEVVLHTNDANVAGFAARTMTPKERPEVVERLRCAIAARPGTRLVHTANAAEDLCMEWALAIATAAGAGRRRAA